MMMDAFVLLVLHTSIMVTVSYTVISTYEGKFRFALACCNSVYIRTDT